MEIKKDLTKMKLKEVDQEQIIEVHHGKQRVRFVFIKANELLPVREI